MVIVCVCVCSHRRCVASEHAAVGAPQGCFPQQPSAIAIITQRALQRLLTRVLYHCLSVPLLRAAARSWTGYNKQDIKTKPRTAERRAHHFQPHSTTLVLLRSSSARRCCVGRGCGASFAAGGGRRGGARARILPAPTTHGRHLPHCSARRRLPPLRCSQASSLAPAHIACAAACRCSNAAARACSREETSWPAPCSCGPHEVHGLYLNLAHGRSSSAPRVQRTPTR